MSDNSQQPGRPDKVKWTAKEVLEEDQKAQAYREAMGFELLKEARFVVETDTDVTQSEATNHVKYELNDALWNYERSAAAALITRARLDGFEAGLEAAGDFIDNFKKG